MAKVVTLRKDGERLTFDQELPYVFSLLANGTYHITIKKASEKRSIPQNDLMWMWFECISRETCTPKDDIYMYYCKKFLMKTIQIGNKEERIYTTSSKLNKEQMREFLEKIQVEARTELGIRLPLPEDRYFTEFYEHFNY